MATKGKAGQLGSGTPMQKTMGQGPSKPTQAPANKPPKKTGPTPGAGLKKKGK